jgi:hypothetical protein
MPACDNCGAGLRSDATFCVTCGASQKPRAREDESAASRSCRHCGARLAPGEPVCTSCREALALSSTIDFRDHGSQDVPGSRPRGSSTAKSCIVCNSRQPSLLGLTIGSRPRCSGCGVYYCGSCRDQLEEKKVRWWVPTLSGSGTLCRECGEEVPKPFQWYEIFLFGPGCLVSPAVLSALAISVMLLIMVLF